MPKFFWVEVKVNWYFSRSVPGLGSDYSENVKYASVPRWLSLNSGYPVLKTSSPP